MNDIPKDQIDQYVKHLIRYRYFVEEIEQGFSLCISEYTNELSSRDFLQEIKMLHPSIDDTTPSDIASLDDRLRKLLKQTKKPLSWTGRDYWWQNGLPHNAAGELLEDAYSLDYW